MKRCLIVLALVLQGCVPTEIWLREGISGADRNRIVTNCQVKATQNVPTNTQVGWAPYVGIYSADTNTNLRAQVITQCYADKGLRRVELPICSAEISNAIRKTRPTGHKRIRVTEQTCYVQMYDGSQYIYTPG